MANRLKVEILQKAFIYLLTQMFTSVTLPFLWSCQHHLSIIFSFNILFCFVQLLSVTASMKPNFMLFRLSLFPLILYFTG